MERYNHQSFPEEEKREVGRFSPLNFKWTVDPRQHSLPLKTYPDISFSIISIVKSNQIPPVYVNINFLWKNFNQLIDSLEGQVHLSMVDRGWLFWFWSINAEEYWTCRLHNRLSICDLQKLLLEVNLIK